MEPRRSAANPTTSNGEGEEEEEVVDEEGKDCVEEMAVAVGAMVIAEDSPDPADVAWGLDSGYEPSASSSSG